MHGAHPPQFGAREDGRVYGDRHAAFGIAVRAGEIALVRVEKEGFAPWHDLPGGGLDPGETDEQAVVREFGEETGLKVAPGAVVCRADQYFVNTDDEAFNNRSAVFEVTVEGADAALKIEEDHELVWFPPHIALEILRHDSHAWAVAAWLRKRA